ncbi:unnamed protein product, partial [Mesorhabditis spiculigera]
MMSDFEEVLDKKERFDERDAFFEGGYQSDYTGYHSRPKPLSTVPHYRQNRPDPLAFDNAIAKGKYSNGVRAQIQKSQPITALGRTLSEIKARQSMETLVESSPSRPSSTTPFDPALLTCSSRLTTRSEHDLLPPKSPRTETSNLPWRSPGTAAPPPLPKESRTTTPSNPGNIEEFASMRRGRESGLPAPEGPRIRYYSASPKLPRRFTAAPNLDEAGLNGHSVENGHTNGHHHPVAPPKPPPRDTRSISVGTGPIPPPKPCIECPELKKRLDYVVANPAIPEKPKMRESGTCTAARPTVSDACIGADKLTQINIGIATDKYEEPKPEVLHQEAQTPQKELLSVGVEIRPKMYTVNLDTFDLEKRELAHTSCNTDGEFVPAEPSVPVEEKCYVDGHSQFETITVEVGCGAEIDVKHSETMTNRVYQRTLPVQTTEVETKEMACSPVASLLELHIEELKAQLAAASIASSPATPSTSDAEAQTELEIELLHELSEPRLFAEAELTDSIWLSPEKVMSDASCETEEVEAPECEKCHQKENVFLRNVGVGACSVTDKVCAGCDEAMAEVDENEVPGFSPPTIELTRATATKKLLEQTTPFVRGTQISRSCRETKRSNSGDDLEYLEQQHIKKAQKEPSPSSAPTVPSIDNAEALTGKVVLKKEPATPSPCKVPDPIPARIPRPKISKYAVPHGEAETPDEMDEAQDRLTPLRSELRVLGRWNRPNTYEPPVEERSSEGTRTSDSDGEGAESDDSEGTYECQDELTEGTPFEISAPLMDALNSLNGHLQNIEKEPTEWALKYVQHEWLKTAARKNSQAAHVEVLLEAIRGIDAKLLKAVVNLTDQNGNSALHYAVSHGNFPVVSSLLDCGECELNLANKAGYTPVMLAALSNLDDDIEKTVVARLFQAGDVNARATQHGQTALMLAVSHGKFPTTQLLIENGADVNIQDEEGSTALMCAAEHGHRDLVKLLLAQPDIDAQLADCDASTALKIAVENGHSDIGVLIYAHQTYTRPDYA